MLTVTGNITIKSGASLELNGEDVVIHGNLTIDGSFEPGEGTVTLHDASVALRDDFLDTSVRLSVFIAMIKRLAHE